MDIARVTEQSEKVMQEFDDRSRGHVRARDCERETGVLINNIEELHIAVSGRERPFEVDT